MQKPIQQDGVKLSHNAPGLLQVPDKNWLKRKREMLKNAKKDGF